MADAVTVQEIADSSGIKYDMFSINPKIGTSTLRNISIPLRASIKAISCGVETITTPSNFNRWLIVN